MGKDNLIYIWQFTQLFDGTLKTGQDKVKNGQSTFNATSSNPHKYKIKCSHEIRAHMKHINSINWSTTDDRWILTASTD